MTDDQILSDAKAAFALCEEAESENRIAALDDLRFAKLGEQWPDHVRQQRIRDGRPCLTINRQPAFIRQVVNEARQNRPGIKVHPVDSEADVEIAEIYNGLIRNIEQTSKADVAYDTFTFMGTAIRPPSRCISVTRSSRVNVWEPMAIRPTGIRQVHITMTFETWSLPLTSDTNRL